VNKLVHIQYFAIMREQRGVGRETVTTEADTPAELYAELRRLHPFTLPQDRLRVAIAGEFAPWTTQLNDGVELVFIPPVAGG
jgi:molybdopterin converting factor small subunit